MLKNSKNLLSIKGLKPNICYSFVEKLWFFVKIYAEKLLKSIIKKLPKNKTEQKKHIYNSNTNSTKNKNNNNTNRNKKCTNKKLG